MSQRPQPGEYQDYYEGYIGLVTESDIGTALASQVEAVRAALAAVPDDQTDVVHAPYGWTIKQVWAHCLDTERVFGYRALRFAVNDPTPLPGFDQDLFVANSPLAACTLTDLVEEFCDLRRSHLHFFRRLDEAAWQRGGLADGKRMTVRAIAYVLVGHVRHHLHIVQQRLDGLRTA